MFTRWFYLFFALWTLESRILDCKFEFYVKFPTQNRLESSGIRNLGQNLAKTISLFGLFLIRSWGYIGFIRFDEDFIRFLQVF